MANSQRPDGFSLIEIVVVVGLIGVISAIAIPMFGNLVAGFRVSGDAQSVSNATAVVKMRAASDFSRVRLYVDLVAKTHKVQSWSKVDPMCCWVTAGGTTALSTGVTFGYGPVTTAPPDTQDTIGQASLCTDDDGTTIANTACIMFNSRGVPIDSTFAPTGNGALYVTDGAVVYGVTVAATGMLRLWRTLPTAIPEWGLS